MTSTNRTRSALVAWLRGENWPTPRDGSGTEPETKPEPESPEQVGLAGLFVVSILGGLIVAGLVGPVGWLLVGFGGLCLIAYLVVGAIDRR